MHKLVFESEERTLSLTIEKPGILTTIQDLGRSGYRRFGINTGGVMDRAAARIINILLGNDENEAVIEMHFPAADIHFRSDVIFALGGAEFGAELDGYPLEPWRPVFAPADSKIKFTRKMSGSRAYLAVKGGFKLEHWLGSSSTNLAAVTGGVEGRKLRTGDVLELRQSYGKPPHNISNVRISSSLLPRYSSFPTARIVAGAEFDRLPAADQDLLTKQDLSISNASDRMGFRLLGEPLSLSEPLELLSSAVDFGTIQLLPDGQLIVLMADHQTTGGYPRLAHVISRDLPLLAQLGANDKVAFHLVDRAHAEELALEFERDIDLLRVGCRYIWQ